MGLLKQNKRLFDPVRKKWVHATPEEMIRQALIQKMLGELGYPLSFLAVECELSQLPHLQRLNKDMLAKRRADIIVFAKKTLLPLLMIECKAVALTPKFAEQVIGYNAALQSPFLAIANEREVLTGFFDQNSGHYQFKAGLPRYLDLIHVS